MKQNFRQIDCSGVEFVVTFGKENQNIQYNKTKIASSASMNLLLKLNMKVNLSYWQNFLGLYSIINSWETSCGWNCALQPIFQLNPTQPLNITTSTLVGFDMKMTLQTPPQKIRRNSGASEEHLLTTTRYNVISDSK